MTMTANTDTARDQAIAQLENIQAMVTRLGHAQIACDWEECDEWKINDNLCEFTSESYHDEEAARERIDESPLSVMVRSDWYVPINTEYMKPVEFEILLMTGGPAVRIIGELDEGSTPTRARLQYQDWGTPWTELLDPRDMDALISYASNFYFTINTCLYGGL